MSLTNGDHLEKDFSFLSKRCALVVGVDTSTKTPGLIPLKYAESDARGMHSLLQREESDFVFSNPVLVGEAAKTQDVRQAVIHLTEKRRQNDLLLFYFIGHGYPVLNRGDVADIYLVTADFDPDIAQLDPSAYISLRWIQQTLLEKNKISDIAIILDCIYTKDTFRFLENRVAQQFHPLIQQYLDDFKRTELHGPNNRSWVTLVTAPESLASSRPNDGHTSMTSLILEALGGKGEEALNREENISLSSLYNYLIKNRKLPGLLHLALQGEHFRDQLLAKHPAQNPVKVSLEEFIPGSEKTQETISDAKWQFFDMTPCQSATFADLDFEQVNAFLQKERVLLQDDYRADLGVQEQLEELGLLQGGYPTYGALLCFGRRPTHQLAGAFTRCLDWRGVNRQSGLQDEKEYRSGLLQQFVTVCHFLWEKLHFARDIKPGGSSERPEIPFRVLEEALANALIHREYVVGIDRRPRSEGVQVEIFRDRVEISSPGKPPSPLSVSSLVNASRQHPGSHPRNPLIMRIFYLAGYVERVGSGVERIQHLMRDVTSLPPRFLLKEQDQVLALVLSRRGQTGSLPALEEVVASVAADKTEIADSLSPPMHNVEERQTTDALTDVSLPILPDVSRDHSRFRGPRRVLVTLLCLVLIAGLVLGGLAWYNGAFARGNRFAPASPVLSPSTTIEIASDFPTSGTDRTLGLPLQNGVEMAITEANNNNLLPGYLLKLIPFDDVGANNRPDPQKGALNIHQAITDPLVAGIVGPGNSAVVRIEAPIANQAPIALVSPDTTYPCLTKTADVDPACSGIYNIEPQMRPTGRLTYFRLAAPDNIQGKAAADFLFTTRHYHRVVLFKDDTDTYSQGLAQAFQSEWTHLGGVVTPQDLQQAVSSEQDYQNVLQSAVSFQPDLVYFAGDQPNGNEALQALTSIPALKKVAFAGGDGLSDTALPNAAATLHLSAPVYVSLTTVDPEHAGTTLGADFKSQYIANGYSNYYPLVPSAYDCTMMLIQAIRTVLQQGISTPHGARDQAGGQRFRQQALQALAQNKYTDGTGTHGFYTGATGKHSFDSNGDTTTPTVSFYQADLTNPTQPGWKWVQQISG